MDIRVKYFGLGGIAEVWIEYIETYKRITSVFFTKNACKKINTPGFFDAKYFEVPHKFDMDGKQILC